MELAKLPQVTIKSMQLKKYDNFIINKQIHYILVVNLFVLCNSCFSQNTDSIKHDKSKYIAIVGFKLNLNKQMPNIYTSSVLGIEYKLKNKKISFAFRNFFNSQYAGKRTPIDFRQKNLLFLTSKNCFDVHYTIPTKNKTNYLKVGTGIYFERDQDFGGQFLGFTNGHFQGIELSLYSKLKWLNIGFRHQIQLFYNYNVAVIAVSELQKFNLCFEIPINIK